MYRNQYIRMTCVSVLFAGLMCTAACAADPESIAPARYAQGQFVLDRRPAHLLYHSKNWVRKKSPLNGHYLLETDIDMAGISGFAPIGKDKENTLLGIFDG